MAEKSFLRQAPMAQQQDIAVQPSLAARMKVDQLSWSWLGVMPFFIFALLFLIIPTGFLIVGGFQDADGHFTFANIANLFQPTILSAYWISIKVSAASAIGGAIIGFFLAYAGVIGDLPRWIRPTLMTFCGVASNFAGLALTYLYFQIPLMVLILTPALDGLKREWREASAILGASAWQYWRYIALPVLWPAMLGTTLLLFANAFGAVATAYGLTGSSLNIVTILLYAQIRGDVLHDQNLGYALALGMILVTGISNAAYIWLRARGERGMR